MERDDIKKFFLDLGIPLMGWQLDEIFDRFGKRPVIKIGEDTPIGKVSDVTIDAQGSVHITGIIRGDYANLIGSGVGGLSVVKPVCEDGRDKRGVWEIPSGGWGHHCEAKRGQVVCHKYGSACNYCGEDRHPFKPVAESVSRTVGWWVIPGDSSAGWGHNCVVNGESRGQWVSAKENDRCRHCGVERP